MNDKELLKQNLLRKVRSQLLTVRCLQIAGGISSSELFEIFASVFNQTGGDAEKAYMNYMVQVIKSRSKNE